MYRLLAPLAATMLLLAMISPVAHADEGIATWYGPGFQGHQMYDGQIYDMNDPTTTAANRWPLGTWLKVTNPANGHSVTVQVRDRGAFSQALDLSYAAFAALDDPRKMQITVDYEVVPGPGAPPAPTPTPAPTPPPAPAVPARSNTTAAADAYIVQPGDTLAGISAATGVPMAALVTMNGIGDPNSIAVGQSLRLHEPARPVESSRSDATNGVSKKPATASGYVVVAGDTLDAIAARLGMDADTLAALNGISNGDMIEVGEQLRTSPDSSASSSGSAPSSGKTVYTVVAGDTLSGIASKFGVSEDAIVQLNGISDPDTLDVGSNLQIPTGDSSSSAAQANTPPKQHTVQQGETLNDIADAYGVDADSIARYNGIDDPNLLQPGQVLTIP